MDTPTWSGLIGTLVKGEALTSGETAWADGRAGLATGPRKLNTVGTPSSRRGGPACRRAG